MEAFAADAMHKAMHPPGVNDESLETVAGSIFPSPKEAADPSVEIIIMVAELLAEGSEADGTQEPVIVAFAKWKLVKEEQPREKWDARDEEMSEDNLGKVANTAVFEKFVSGLHEMKTRWVKGEPHMSEFLGSLPHTRQQV
ncbi:hypothetical protein F5883DRAFT_588034 [Diaporthe sp. PMI_573]|nr:hypothetical protein F5883DRAFT_588397 [Diaporthaceae sp. PMI_573]KAH8745104.1 hypothetical protein F5883DRAFT_588034 [Diaporthaceae sp. PMI_573]